MCFISFLSYLIIQVICQENINLSTFIKIVKNQKFEIKEVIDLSSYQNKLETFIHWHIYDVNKCI